MLYFQMVIMAGTVMLAYYFEYTDTFAVNVQGFFCHDSAYRKPYPGPEDSSAVPPALLYSLAAGVPALVVSPRPAPFLPSFGRRPRRAWASPARPRGTPTPRGPLGRPHRSGGSSHRPPPRATPHPCGVRGQCGRGAEGCPRGWVGVRAWGVGVGVGWGHWGAS